MELSFERLGRFRDTIRAHMHCSHAAVLGHAVEFVANSNLAQMWQQICLVKLPLCIPEQGNCQTELPGWELLWA